MASILLASNLAALVWVVRAREALYQRQVALVKAGNAIQRRQSISAAQPADIDSNLQAFYRTLGDRHHEEQQIRNLFALAGDDRLVLSEGEYAEAFETHAKFYTYQVTLPVKGTYHAIWAFSLRALQAIPFASLDEITFRRDAVGDPNVEARLRYTLYLGDRLAGGAE